MGIINNKSYPQHSSITYQSTIQAAKHCAILVKRSSISKGLAIKSFGAPAWLSDAARSCVPDIRITGSELVSLVCFIFLQIDRPSNPASITSINKRSGLKALMSANTLSPQFTVIISYPSSTNKKESISKISLSSSSTSIFFGITLVYQHIYIPHHRDACF
jgi:hypothetical protein